MILIAAIAVGCIAAFVVLKYVSGIEDRANEDAERVPVLVVRQDIPQGTPGEQAVEQNMIVEDMIAREFLPATQITDLDQIAGKVALNNMAANQVLVDGMFVDPATAQLSGLTQRLEENHVAYTISVDELSGVAGLLVPGDLVDMFVSIQEGTPEAVEDAPATEETESQGLFAANARLLYHQVRILAIGSQTAPTAGEQAAADPAAEGEAAAPAPTSGGGLLTLDLPLDAAQLIASLPAGSIKLALTGPDYSATPLPRIDTADLEDLPGETNNESRFGQLTPYGPDGPQ
jgi:pilus assembly protein CpaB